MSLQAFSHFVIIFEKSFSTSLDYSMVSFGLCDSDFCFCWRCDTFGDLEKSPPIEAIILGDYYEDF